MPAGRIASAASGAGQRVDAPLHGPVATPREDQVGALVESAAGTLVRLAALRHLVPERVGDALGGEDPPQLVETTAETLARVGHHGHRRHRMPPRGDRPLSGNAINPAPSVRPRQRGVHLVGDPATDPGSSSRPPDPAPGAGRRRVPGGGGARHGARVRGHARLGARCATLTRARPTGCTRGRCGSPGAVSFLQWVSTVLHPWVAAGASPRVAVAWLLVRRQRTAGAVGGGGHRRRRRAGLHPEGWSCTGPARCSRTRSRPRRGTRSPPGMRCHRIVAFGVALLLVLPLLHGALARRGLGGRRGLRRCWSGSPGSRSGSTSSATSSRAG